MAKEPITTPLDGNAEGAPQSKLHDLESEIRLLESQIEGRQVLERQGQGQGGHALRFYSLDLRLLELRNERRLLQARQRQEQ